MIIKNLDISNKQEVAFLEKLYIESFPLSERRPVDEMFDLYKNDSPFIISTAIDREIPIGFLTHWDLKDFIFAEHFAVSPEFRNEGYGRKVMDLFLEHTQMPIVLEVELPTTILSERRIGFYQRIGFKLWEEVQYQQPSYHNDGNAIPMKLMSYGDINIEQDLKVIKGQIYSTVYNY